MIVSFLGTKGGTGTTTLAVNGAADICRITNRSTIIVDLKNGPGDVALFLGLRPRHSVLTALDHLAWLDPSTYSRYVIEHDCGLHVLAAGDEYGRPGIRDTDAVEQTLRALDSIYDYVILDVGTSLMIPAASALQLSDKVLLVGEHRIFHAQFQAMWSDWFDTPAVLHLMRESGAQTVEALTDAIRNQGVTHVVVNRAELELQRERYWLPRFAPEEIKLLDEFLVAHSGSRATVPPGVDIIRLSGPKQSSPPDQASQ